MTLVLGYDFRSKKIRKYLLVSILCVVLFPGLVSPALAHTTHGHGDQLGFTVGFLHPLAGLDHLLGMIAVGLWGALLGNPALWVLPIIFPMIMAIGSILGLLGVPVPLLELGITLSVVCFGFFIALDKNPGHFIAYCIVGLFAIFHGYAHGLEMPEQIHQLSYTTGFVISTGLIHLAGIVMGLVDYVPRGRFVIRAGGACIALMGFYLTFQGILF